MSGNDAFELVSERGWRRGFDNMLRSGLDRWFKTRRWWVNCLLWGGLVAFILFSLMYGRHTPPVEVLLIVALPYIGLLPAVGAIIVMYDAIVGEKREGTAAWVFSKPLTRPAFVLSKLVANSIGVLLTMTIIPCTIVFSVTALIHKSALSPLGTLEAVGVFFINLFFYLTFTLMLGTLFSSRRAVIGIAFGVLFLQHNPFELLPYLGPFLPRTLIESVENSVPIAYTLVLGDAVQAEQIINLLLVIAESILFALVAIWRFNREEF